MRFRPTQEGNLYEKFLAINQGGMVADFRREFEVLTTPLKGVSNEVLESTFVNGLKPEVRLLGPKGLGPIMEVAQKIEDKNLIVKNIQEVHER